MMLQSILSFVIISASIALAVFVFNRKPHNQVVPSDEFDEVDPESDQNGISPFDSFDQLWAKLVPEFGSAETIQGELIRSIGRLSHDYYANGYTNWGGEFQNSLSLIKSHLMDGTFDSSKTKEIQSDITEIEAYIRDEQRNYDLDEAHQRLLDATTLWCQRHTELIAYGKNNEANDFARTDTIKPNNGIIVQFALIPNLNPSDLINEATLFDNPFLRSTEISDSLCEHFVLKIESVNHLFDFFKIKASLLHENLWKLSIQDLEVLSEEYLDEKYQSWIDISGQENTMDEYGSLLMAQTFLKSHSSDEIFAVLRIK